MFNIREVGENVFRVIFDMIRYNRLSVVNMVIVLCILGIRYLSFYFRISFMMGEVFMMFEYGFFYVIYIYFLFLSIDRFSIDS